MMGHPELLVGFASFWSEHPDVTRVVAIVVMFAMGYLEGPIMKQRSLACVTWTMGLLVLSGCIAYWLQNPVGIVLAGVVFVAGMAVIASYYKQAGATADG